MNDDGEFKPCPYCGSNDIATEFSRAAHEVHDHREIRIARYHVHCDGCGMCTGAMKDEEKLVREWNAMLREEEVHADLLTLWNSPPDVSTWNKIDALLGKYAPGQETPTDG